jgi:hypothetical protein
MCKNEIPAVLTALPVTPQDCWLLVFYPELLVSVSLQRHVFVVASSCSCPADLGFTAVIVLVLLSRP